MWVGVVGGGFMGVGVVGGAPHMCTYMCMNTHTCMYMHVW